VSRHLYVDRQAGRRGYRILAQTLRQAQLADHRRDAAPAIIADKPLSRDAPAAITHAPYITDVPSFEDTGKNRLCLMPIRRIA